MVFHVSADIHERLCTSIVGSGLHFDLALMSCVSLPFVIHSALFVGGIVGTVVCLLLKLLWVFGVVPGMVTQTV